MRGCRNWSCSAMRSPFCNAVAVRNPVVVRNVAAVHFGHDYCGVNDHSSGLAESVVRILLAEFRDRPPAALAAAIVRGDWVLRMFRPCPL